MIDASGLLFNLFCRRLKHPHCESDGAALVLPIRVHLDCAMVGLYKPLADQKAHATPLLIHVRSALQLAKQVEQLLFLVRLDPLARVNHSHCHSAVIKRRDYMD